jgi:hypothetical protein
MITCGTIEEKIYRRQVYVPNYDTHCKATHQDLFCRFKGSLVQSTITGVNSLRYFSREELEDLFRLESTTTSATQQDLHKLHSQQRKSDDHLEEHIKFLQTIGVYGLSDHDLLFTKQARAVESTAEARQKARQAVQDMYGRPAESEEVEKKPVRRSRRGKGAKDDDSWTEEESDSEVELESDSAGSSSESVGGSDSDGSDSSDDESDSENGSDGDGSDSESSSEEDSDDDSFEPEQPKAKTKTQTKSGSKPRPQPVAKAPPKKQTAAKPAPAARDDNERRKKTRQSIIPDRALNQFKPPVGGAEKRVTAVTRKKVPVATKSTASSGASAKKTVTTKIQPQATKAKSNRKNAEEDKENEKQAAGSSNKKRGVASGSLRSSAKGKPTRTK